MENNEFQLSPHDSEMIARYEHSDELNAKRVYVVNEGALGGSSCSGCQPQEPVVVKPEVVYVDKPIIVEHQKIELKEVEKPVIIKEQEIKLVEIEKQIIVEKQVIVHVDKPVYIEKLVEIEKPVVIEKNLVFPEWLKYLLIANIVVQLVKLFL